MMVVYGGQEVATFESNTNKPSVQLVRQKEVNFMKNHTLSPRAQSANTEPLNLIRKVG